MGKKTKGIQILDAFVAALDDYKDCIPQSLFDVSIRSSGIVISIKDDSSLTEYARYVNNDEGILIQSSVLTSVEAVDNMMQYFTHLYQEMKVYKKQNQVS